MTKHTNEKLVFEFGAIYTTRGTSIAKMDRDEFRTSPTERDANARRFVQIWNLWPDVVALLEQSEGDSLGIDDGDLEDMLRRIREEVE